MTPRMTTDCAFCVLGVVSRVIRGSESPELFAGIWSRFESRRQEIEAVATERAYLGVSFPTDDEAAIEYVAGMRVAPDTLAAQGLEVRSVSGGEYAIFECPLDAIGATWRQIFTVWLPSAALQVDPTRAPFEEYPEKTVEQPVRLHIPVLQQPT